jgi:hypothetical protein
MKELAPAELRQFPEKLITAVAIDYLHARPNESSAFYLAV